MVFNSHRCTIVDPLLHNYSPRLQPFAGVNKIIKTHRRSIKFPLCTPAKRFSNLLTSFWDAKGSFLIDVDCAIVEDERGWAWWKRTG